MKKKSDISQKVEELENAEDKISKQDKIQYGPGRRGVMVGVTAGVCAVLVVGGYFLVGKLVDLSNENQTSNAPATSYDSGSFIPGDIIHTSGNDDTAVSDIDSPSAGDNSGAPGNTPGNTPGNVPGGDGSGAVPGVSPSGDPADPRGGDPAVTSSRDTGAMTDSGDGGEPVESGIIVPGGAVVESIIVPANKRDIYPSGDITVPPSTGGDTTGAGSGEYDDPEYTVPAATVPEYTTGSGSWTTAATTGAATTKSSTSARTTARSGESTTSSGTTATTKKQDEPDDHWDRLPDISDLETVEPFEGKLSDFFH